MTRTALALSPHLDDAAFSCGGTLFALAGAGWRVVVATLFTRSVPDPAGFALACQLDKGLGPDVDYMALRRAEDLAAMAALGPNAAAIHVPLPEAPHRGYDGAAALFGPILSADDVGPRLAASIRALIREHAPGILLAPQAVGGHVDHVQVAEAVFGLDPGLPVSWWTDFPYSLRRDTPARPFERRLAALPAVEVRLTAAARTARAAACSAYASQLGYQFGGAAGLEARLAELGPAERFRGAAPPVQASGSPRSSSGTG